MLAPGQCSNSNPRPILRQSLIQIRGRAIDPPSMGLFASVYLTMTPQSIAPHEPLPHRKVIREWLTPLSKRTTAYPIALLVLDYSLLLAALAGVVLFAPLWAKLLSGLAAGVAISRLFIIGH